MCSLLGELALGLASPCHAEGRCECLDDECVLGYSSASREVALDAVLRTEETELRRRECGDECVEAVEVGDQGSDSVGDWSGESA